MPMVEVRVVEPGAWAAAGAQEVLPYGAPWGAERMGVVEAVAGGAEEGEPKERVLSW